ncbi:TetR-like C-terminal domain-containing protein [Fructilactobacillus sp. Tb1]|uniref:TetR-like C-terminal domain-containing protein n=1 Tax=Fructilactobacillus sp. Tb1 TaxID=3422304 RepID=UPI003D2C4491
MSRVKDSIAEAFIDEVAIIPITEINASNLINEAGVSRRSYYNNFRSMVEVADYAIEMVSSSLDMGNFMRIKDTDELVTKGFVLFTNAIYEHRDEMKLFYTSDLKGRWVQFLIKKYRPLVRDVVFKNYDNSNPIPKSSAVSVYTYTMIGSIEDWITQPIPVKPEIYREYLLDTLKTAPEDLIYGPEHDW